MGAWAPAGPAMDPSIKIPEGMAVAAMGRRIGAWILDFIFATLLALVPLILTFIIGAVTVNQQALDQYDEYARSPWADVTVPLLDVKMGLLGVVAVVYLALMALYFAGAWVVWGASPGQKMLGLRVTDAATAERLPVGRALLRWAVLAGAAQAIFALFMIRLFDWMSRAPANEYLNQSGSGAYADVDSGLSTLSLLATWGVLLWMIVLVVVAGIDRTKRGWHDKLAGSIVVGQIPYSAYGAYPGYGAAPAWPPQPAGTPPQAPAWPPQPAGTPPQAPAWPPQAPGYPPSAYPGYPGYPGYPPQAAPVPPPAAPEPPAAEAPADKPKRAPRKKPQG